MRCLDIAVGLAAGECPLSEGNRTAFCGKCGLSSENIIIVSDEEYATAVPKAGVVDHGASLTSLEQAGDVNVVSINAIPNADASAKFYVINTGSIDAEDVTVTFTGTDGKLETRSLSVPVFNRGTNPIDFVVPIRVRPQRAGDVSLGNFTVSYAPRKGTTRTYMRRVSATVPPPAEMHVSCELMTFSQKVNRRTFRISNHGGLPGYVRVNLRGDAPQWALSYIPNNGLGAAPANLAQYLIPAGDSLTFQVMCTGQANPGRIDVTGDTTNHAITLSYDGVRIQQSLNRPIYMIGIDLGTRQTSTVIRHLPLGQEPPEPLMVDLSNSGNDGEVRVETKISIGLNGEIHCGTDIESGANPQALIIHEIKSMLYEAAQDPLDSDYEMWWDRNNSMRRFTYPPLPDGTCPIKLDQLFRGNVTVYEQLLRWTFPYVNWLKGKVKESISLKTTTAGWPEYEYVTDEILWVFTVPVRDYRLTSGSTVAVGYNRYILTLLRVLCRANWFGKKTVLLSSLLETILEDDDISIFLENVENEYGVRFEVESVAAICGVYNHPLSNGQFSAGLVGRNVYLIDSGGGTTDVVQVHVTLKDDDRRLAIEPVEVLGQDSEGKVFGGELVTSALMTFSDTSHDVSQLFDAKAIRDTSPTSPYRRVFAEDTKKLSDRDMADSFAQLDRRFTWGHLKNIPVSYSREFLDAIQNPIGFVSNLVPKCTESGDARDISTRIDSILNAVQSRYNLGGSLTDDYYVIVGGNSKFIPLQRAVRARLGDTMSELLSTSLEVHDKLRELFVCYGSVFVRDTKSSENYECPIFVTLGGQSTREVHPGDRMVREFASASNVFEVTLSTLRLNEKVAVDSRLVQDTTTSSRL